MTKQDKALFKAEQKLQVASSAAMSAQHSALAKVVEARERRGDFEDAEERLGGAQVAANKGA